MTRHLADHRAPSAGGRTQRFVQIERREAAAGPHPAVRAALARRPAAGTRRLAEFLRIARGRTV